MGGCSIDRRVCLCFGSPGLEADFRIVTIDRTNAEPSKPTVLIKVGGSLLDWTGIPAKLRSFLGTLGDQSSRVVIMVGGGKTVDVIRELDEAHRFGDFAAHWLAIKALDLTAEILASMLPGSVVVNDPSQFTAAWESGITPILAPSRLIATLGDVTEVSLPASWEVTSDSIAAWLAIRLSADRLILLKSTDIPERTSLSHAAALGIVDPFFPRIASDLRRVDCLNARNPRARLTPLVVGE